MSGIVRQLSLCGGPARAGPEAQGRVFRGGGLLDHYSHIRLEAKRRALEAQAKKLAEFFRVPVELFI